MTSSTFGSICASVLLVITIDCSIASEYSGLLSSLYKKAADHNRPLILVLDNSKPASGNSKHTKIINQPIKPLINEATELDGSISTYLQMLKEIQKKQPTSSLSKPPQHSHDDTIVKSLKDQPSRHHSRDLNRNNPILRSRSPIVNNLLRMANQLNCDARDNCVQKCKKITCVKICQVEYECEDEKEAEESNSCEDSGSDGCNEEENEMSTKGERLVTDTTYCARC